MCIWVLNHFEYVWRIHLSIDVHMLCTRVHVLVPCSDVISVQAVSVLFQDVLIVICGVRELCLATSLVSEVDIQPRLPCSLSVGHSESRRMTDELGSRQRDLSTSSVTKRANGHWHAIIASSCRWSQREYKRQPVHRINHPFASEPSGGVSLLLFLTLRESFTSAGVTAQQRWPRSHGTTTVREDSHTGVCGGQLPCVLQH